MRRSALYITAALLAVSACNEAVMTPQQMGVISLSLSSDAEVVVSTKADMDCSDFLVNIYGETFLGQSYMSEQFVYSELKDKEIEIPYGSYHVVAQNCLEEDAEAGFGCARYYGISGQIDVFSQTPSKATVECTMANGVVTITFDESFLEDFSDITVDIKSSRQVSMTSDQANSGQKVYFNVPETGSHLIYTIYGTIAKGTESERRLTYTNMTSPITLLPAQWAKITIMSNHNGAIGPDIDVDDNMGSQFHPEIIDPDDGEVVVDGSAGLPDISVDTQIDNATVLDCIIDIM